MELTRRIVLVALYVFIQDWEIKQVSILHSLVLVGQGG